MTRDLALSESQRDWLPIALAVFRFVIVYPRRSAKNHQDDLNPFSVAAFRKFEVRQHESDSVAHDADPLSLRNLETILQAEARARHTEIDLDTPSFRFSFDLADGAAAMSFAPWHFYPPWRPATLLSPVDLAALEAEALFNKGSGLVLIADEKAKQSAQQHEAAFAAASLVWNQSMLPNFARSVSDGRIKIYARARSRLAKFQQLPADLWSKLNVEDWRNGTACDPEGDRYYSIHATGSLPQVSSPRAEVWSEPATKRRTNNARGRPPEYKWDEIKTFALDLVRKLGKPGEGNRKLPRQEDLVIAVQDDMAEKGLHPGASTVRRNVAKWLKEL